MTENYLHFDSADYAKAISVQEGLLPSQKPKTETAETGESKQGTHPAILEFPERKTA